MGAAGPAQPHGCCHCPDKVCASRHSTRDCPQSSVFATGKWEILSTVECNSVGLGIKGKLKCFHPPFIFHDTKHRVCRQLEADKAAIAKDLASSHGKAEQGTQSLPRTAGATQDAAKISALYHTPACQRTQEMTETIEKLRAQLLVSQRISQVPILHECRICALYTNLITFMCCMASVRCCCTVQVAEEEMQHLKQASHAYAYANP